MEDRRQHGAYRRENKHYQKSKKNASIYGLRNGHSAKTRDCRYVRLETDAEGEAVLWWSGQHRAVLFASREEIPDSKIEQAEKGDSRALETAPAPLRH